MLIRIQLKLRPDMPAHLPLPKFLELIKDDETINPTTKAMLEGMKKAHQNYVPLPLEHYVILSSKKRVTLHRDMKPLNKIWTLENWTESNVKEYNRDKSAFLAKILGTYQKMGYNYAIYDIKMEEVNKILAELETLMQKAKKRLERMGL